MQNDLPLAILSRDAYSPTPLNGAKRIGYEDISADITGSVCAVRGTDSFATLRRDFEICGIRSPLHPTLGACQAGAMRAALGLLDQIPAEVDTFTGHSEGGGIAPILAALRATTARLVVTWDGVKPGGAELVAVLAGVEVRSYRFSGSPVTFWALGLDLHVRVPLIMMGNWTPNPLQAHSIDRACAWLAARGEKALAA